MEEADASESYLSSSDSEEESKGYGKGDSSSDSESESEDDEEEEEEEDEQSNFQCNICLENYDAEVKIPRIIWCGHTLCERCLKDIQDPITKTIKCPFDKKLFKPTATLEFPRNYSILEKLEKRQMKNQ